LTPSSGCVDCTGYYEFDSNEIKTVHTYIHTTILKGGTTILKVTPHLWLTWGGHKTGYYSFHYCNYNV